MRGVRRRSMAAALGLLVIATTVTACTPTATPPGSETASATATTSASPQPSASPDATLDPQGTASDNQAFFDSVNRATLADNPSTGGRGMVDALVAAGFDKALMQLTPDTTVGGRDADSIQFSVRFGDDCLIAQFGAAIAYVSTVGPALNDGSCLIGTTRPIDW